MNLISGGPIRPFKKGWALIQSFSKTHYWTEDSEEIPRILGENGRVRRYVALCGHVGLTHNRMPALEPGNFPRCKKCLKQSKKK